MRLGYVGLMLAAAGATAGAAASAAAGAMANAALAQSPESRERFVCTFRGSERFIDIYRWELREPRGGGCRVDYTKDGVTKQVWSARGDYAYCVKRAVVLVTKLSKGGFVCSPKTVEPPSLNGAP